MTQTYVSQDQALARAAGLTSIEAVKACKRTDLVEDHRGRRDILRVVAETNSPGRPVVLYLKRVWKTAHKDDVKSVIRYGTVRSVSRIEWENAQALTRAGIPTAGLVAYGEETGRFWQRFSFILTAAARGQTVERFLRETRDHRLRRQTLAALARHVRKMHSAGFYAPDLFTRHVFVTDAGPDPTFTLIDVARLDRAAPGNLRLIARDLAALNATTPLSLLTTAERVRFLRDYDPVPWPWLFDGIRRRTNTLLKRRKFRTFFL